MYTDCPPAMLKKMRVYKAVMMINLLPNRTALLLITLLFLNGCKGEEQAMLFR